MRTVVIIPVQLGPSTPSTKSSEIAASPSSKGVAPTATRAVALANQRCSLGMSSWKRQNAGKHTR